MERKHQFLGFAIVLLLIGFITYFKKITSRHNFTRYGKILYLTTMIIFVVSIVLFLYFTELNNILSFFIGLFVTLVSEHLVKLFIIMGNKFNPLVIKVIKKITGIDLTDEMIIEIQKSENNKEK